MAVATTGTAPTRPCSSNGARRSDRWWVMVPVGEGPISRGYPASDRAMHVTHGRDRCTLRARPFDPQGHVAIDSSGMLMDATGDPVAAVGDTFTVHMDREALNDYPLGLYDVTVSITRFEPDREIAWTIIGQLEPQIGHVYGYRLEPVDEATLVTSYYDWSAIDPVWRGAPLFPPPSRGGLRG